MGFVGTRDVRLLLGGGIGAGKSTVADVFVQEGFLLIEADRIGHQVLAPGTAATAAVAEQWPQVVIDGVVDRAALAGIVFSGTDNLGVLESMTHPAIRGEILRRIRETEGNIVVEVPILHLELPGDWYRVAVTANVESRLARAVARGGDAEDIARRMENQPSDRQWREWADTTFDNSGAWSVTERSVLAFIAEILR